MPDNDPLTRALALSEATQADPRRVRAEATALMDEAAGTEAAAVARWAAGVAARELGDLDGARELLAGAIDAAQALGLGRRVAQIRDSFALTLFLLGENEAALRQTDLAAPLLRGRERARLRMQRGLLWQRLGQSDRALAEFRQALAGMRRGGDRLGETRLRINRSVIHTYRNDLAAASADLRRARKLSRELRQAMLGAMCAHNLGFNEGRAGRVPAALEWFRTARREYEQLGVEAGHLAVLDADQSELLLWAGLTEEAQAMAERAVGTFERTGNVADLAEAYLLAARAALASGDPARSRELARRAAVSFRRQQRSSWQTLAEYVVVQARLARLTAHSGPRRRDISRLAHAAARSAEALVEHGWTLEASHARIIAARCEMALDNHENARRLLEQAAGARHRGPVMLRTRAWHAVALLRFLDGNPAGSRRAVAAGLRLVDTHRTTLGAAELRASASIHAMELVDFGIGLALSVDDTAGLFAWADRAKAGAIAAHPADPPASKDLAAALQQLRHLERMAEQAALSGHPDRSLMRGRAELEAEIKVLVRSLRGSEEQVPEATVPGVRARLDEATFIEYVSHRGALLAVVVDRHRARRVDLGAISDHDQIVAMARSDLHRLARGAGSNQSLDAAVASLTEIGAEAEVRLLTPLGIDPEVPLVIAPAGAIHGLPWRILPSLTARAFTVVPSARSWVRARDLPLRAADRVLLAAGPDVPHGRQEVASLRRRYPNATQLTGRNASTQRILSELERCDLAHIACHGTFRWDNPMFSALRMADGSLTVFDMERVPSIPSTVVLPACDAAVLGLRPGDELLGLSAALIGMGVRSLVVPQVPIPDAATPPLMQALHGRLRHGLAPVHALAAAIDDARDAAPASFALLRSFIVMGA